MSAAAPAPAAVAAPAPAAVAVAGQGKVSRACANGKLKTESACTHNFNIPQVPHYPPPPTTVAPPAVSRADSPGVVLRTPLCCCDSIPHVVGRTLPLSLSLDCGYPSLRCLMRFAGRRRPPTEKEMKKGEPETASFSDGQTQALPQSAPPPPPPLCLPVLILCLFRSVALQNF